MGAYEPTQKGIMGLAELVIAPEKKTWAVTRTEEVGKKLGPAGALQAL